MAAARDLRSGKIERNDLIDRLAGDTRLGLAREKLEALVGAAGEQTGTAGAQVDAFVAQVASWTKRFPEAASVTPGRML